MAAPLTSAATTAGHRTPVRALHLEGCMKRTSSRFLLALALVAAGTAHADEAARAIADATKSTTTPRNPGDVGRPPGHTLDRNTAQWIFDGAFQGKNNVYEHAQFTREGADRVRENLWMAGTK